MSLLLVLVSFSIRLAHSQVDPSSMTLLGGSKSSPSSGLQSGRYETIGSEPAPEAKAEDERPFPAKKKVEPELKAPPKKTVRKTIPDANGIPVAVIQPKIRRTTASAPEPAPSAVEEKKEQAPAEEPKESAVPAPVPSEPAEVVEEPASKVEIELLSGVAHQDAKSNTVYRNFSLTAPIAGIGGLVWINDHMGFSGRYQTTLSADIGSATVENSRVPVTAEWSELRWKFRREFGSVSRPSSLEYGFIYFENNLKAPADDPTRSTLKSSGFGVGAKLLLPSSKSYNWVVGSSLYPRIRNSESPGSSGFESGSEPESSRFDLTVGGDLRLASANSAFWDLSMNLEKNQFGGTANLSEPNGTPAENVSVLTTTLFFHLGYRWGR